MNLRDFRIGWRLLIKEPGYSAVVLLGLTIGFAAFFLLIGYVRYCLSYDSAVPHRDDIYLIKSKLNLGRPMWQETTPLPFLAVAQRSGLAEASTVVQPVFSAMKVGSRVTKNVKLYAVDAAFPAMFGVRALEGDVQAALTRPDQLALTESQARTLFGEIKVVGKSLLIGAMSFTVAAVLPDPRSNSTVSYAALTGMSSAAWPEAQRNNLLGAWARSAGGRLYVQLKPGASPATLTQVLQDASDRSPIMSELPPDMLSELGGKAMFEMRLGRLADAYFDADTADSPGSVQHGDLKAVYGLAVVALLILVLAMSNYINLATVRTVRRQKEIGMRKLLGASALRLSHQFLAESLLVTLAATALGLLLAQALLPVFSDLMGRQLGTLLTLTNCLAVVGVGIAVSLAAGAYPAWVAVCVRPQQSLTGRGSSETSGALRLRRMLTVVQFATAMALTGTTLAIALQTWYASQADPGFDTRPLLVLELPGEPNSAAMRGLREALARSGNADGVAAAQDLQAGRSFMGNIEQISRNDGQPKRLPLAGVSADFFDVYGLRPVAGRLFDKKIDSEEKAGVLVINGGAARELGFSDLQQAVGQIVAVGSAPDTRSMRIVGVAPDIRFENLRQAAKPLAYVPSVDTTIVTARARGDIGALESEVETLERQYFPNDVVGVRRMDSYYAENYADDLRLAKLLGLSSLIAMSVAAFGIYVLSAYSVQRLTRQIVLRKLFGADRKAIGKLVGREFVVLLGVSALIGLPLAGLWNQRYLAGFVEHAPIGVWPLFAAVLLALAVTLMSTLRHTFIAMRIAPATALREQ
jgi:putative ABC transport system permease protein